MHLAILEIYYPDRILWIIYMYVGLEKKHDMLATESTKSNGAVIGRQYLENW